MAYSLRGLRFWPRLVLLDSETRDTGVVSRKIDFDRLLQAKPQSRNGSGVFLFPGSLKFP